MVIEHSSKEMEKKTEHTEDDYAEGKYCLVVRQRIIIQVYADDVQWLIDLLLILSNRKDNIS